MSRISVGVAFDRENHVHCGFLSGSGLGSAFHSPDPTRAADVDGTPQISLSAGHTLRASQSKTIRRNRPS